MATNFTTVGVDVGGEYITAKAWAYFKTVSASEILGGYGFSGVTDHGTGDTTLTFSNAQPNVYYSVAVCAGDHVRLCQDGDATNTASVRMRSFVGGTNGTLVDNNRNFVTIHGD